MSSTASSGKTTREATQTEPKRQRVHPAFHRLRSHQISSLNIVVEEYEHVKTGARHFHLASDNTENVFLVALRTVPMDSTGVAHILEHTALCGSERFPVRDPFFMMIRRSLNTFMNAFTSSDWTAYPFASKNRKDFNNLLGVYLDAVFFARLHELDFAQEGHRLEFTEPENPDSELQFKGVVFNEMKGAMSSTTSVLWQTFSTYLFPTTTYHYNSGGDPQRIPDLSHEDLKNFYNSHYHPSNAVFMTFGDIPAIEHHKQIEKLALGRFDKLDVHIAVEDEKRYLSPIRVEDYYPGENDTDDRTHVVTGWLLGKSTSLHDLFQAHLLTAVLLDNSASPLLQALETSDLGHAPSPLCGLEDNNREMSFLCGLEGCAENATLAVEKLVTETLETIEKEGVPQEQVEAALHQLELQQREITGDSYPYGLQLILAGLSTAVHRGDPIKVLDIDPVVAELREAIKDLTFIPNLIRKLLLNNTHRLTLTLRPDPGLDDRQADAESTRLQFIKAGLDNSEIKHIITQSKALAARQLQEDDPGVLPKVGLEDIPPTITEPEGVGDILSDAAANAKLSFYGQGTNGISYQQVIIDLPELEPELLAVLPHFTNSLTELGVGDKSYTQVQTWQSRVSGGVNCYASMRSHVDDVQKATGIVVLSSKSLVRNHNDMTDLLARTLRDCRFDESNRVKDLIEQAAAKRESSITGAGHTLAVALASSRMSPAAQLNHQFSGLVGIQDLKQLRKGLGETVTVERLLELFRRIHQALLNAPRQFLLIAEDEHEETLRRHLERYWQNEAKLNRFTGITVQPVRETVRQAWATTTAVNFCAKAFPTVPFSHPDNAALTVLAGFMRNGFLHRAIREQGGAYGAGADQDANSASFRFFSYRDPRLTDTLSDFDRAIDWVVTGTHQSRHLEEAVLGVIASMDKPSSPAGEAKQAFYNRLFNRTLEQRMEFRQRVLDVSLEDLRRVSEAWLPPDSASIGVVGSQESLDKAGLEGVEVIRL
ncbi:MAG: insulinase family protein [Pseudohongiellaceae bacterium]